VFSVRSVVKSFGKPTKLVTSLRKWNSPISQNRRMIDEYPAHGVEFFALAGVYEYDRPQKHHVPDDDA
jgi:hypothetical protein